MTMQKNVLITGVSSGIGLSLARRFLEQGWVVYGISRRQPPEIMGQARLRHRQVDLRDLAILPEEIQVLLHDRPRLDLVILNAGVLGKIGDLGETSLPEIQEVMNVNVWANKTILDTLFKLEFNPQQVVAISSGSAAAAQRGWNAYAISKSALNMLIGLYATERPETHFCALAPGIIDTAMQAQISSLPVDDRFPSLDLLREARGTDLMPKPQEAVDDLLAAMERAPKLPSGSFVDLNSLLGRAW